MIAYCWRIVDTPNNEALETGYATTEELAASIGNQAVREYAKDLRPYLWLRVFQINIEEIE
jgi:hypothetical protein